MKPLVLFVSLTLMALVTVMPAGPAHAGKVEDLSKLLLEEESYKVRVQAALVLGKLADRDAVPALRRALKDQNNTVRAVAAQALGRIGAPEAIKDLKSLLRHEKNSFVRNQVQRALALLDKPRTSTGAAAKIFLELGGFTTGRNNNEKAATAVRAVLQKKLAQISSVTFSISSAERRSFAGSGRRGFHIDGSISLSGRKVGGAFETDCDITAQVSKWPRPANTVAIPLARTNAGAALQGGSRSKDREVAAIDCLEAAADSIADDLKTFLLR